FTLAQIELESEDLNLSVRSYEPLEDNYLLKLTANRLVNSKALSRRIFQLYPDIKQHFLAQRNDILKTIGITRHSDHPDPTLEPPPKATPPDPQSPALADRQSRLYREVVRQIQHILNSQVPDQFVDSVQRLLDFLKGQGISTREIQKRLIGQAILQRAKLDEGFREQLIRWEKSASEEERLSTVGHAVRMAIAMLWNQFL
ncbi:low-complexity protein, partial [Pantanalinema rosaneae CENA516]